MKLSTILLSCLGSNQLLAQRPGAGPDMLSSIDFDDVFHVDNMKSLKESMQGKDLHDHSILSNWQIV